MQGLRTLVEKLDDTCAKALEQAAVLAAARGDYEVRIEHVLIKLLDSDVQNDLQAILEQAGVCEEQLFDALMQGLQRLRTANPDKPVFATRLGQWLEQAWVSSTLHYQHDQIRSLHLLDALLELLPRFGEPALESLQSLSVNTLRDQAAQWLQRSVESRTPASGDEPLSPAAGPVTPAAQRAGKEEALQQFCQDFTELARQADMDPVSGRGNEIRMAVDILCRRRKNNPILVGEPGVGKTAVVEGLAQKIVEGQVPPALQQVRLLGLDLGQLQAGASVKGEFERRLKQVISEIQASSQPIILFIDEAHTLIGAGGEAGQNDAANLLKPALARGGLRTIAATTWAEYKRYFERDAALDRRFQRVPVDEPDTDQALLMLSGLKHKFAEHHGVHLSDEALQAAVTLSRRYIPARQLPDKAIDVLDTAAARVRLSQSCPPAQLDQGNEKVRYLTQRLEALQQDQAQGLATSGSLGQQLRQSREQTRQTLAALEQAWQQEKAQVAQLDGSPESRAALQAIQGEVPLVHPEVTATTVAEVIADWTGIPLGRMQCDELTLLQNLESHLAQRVTGQDSALGLLARSLRTARSGLRKSDAPLGVFLLAGPSGVGKTETARALAENLFGGERSLISINMSEYQESHTVSQLKGSPPGYVGYGEGGVLSEAVRQRPYSVVLLDEVEKAHPDVMNLFYQVFDRGILRDGEGREIDFRNTVILMTSNLGSDVLMQQALPGDDQQPSEKEHQDGLLESLPDLPSETPEQEDGDPIAGEHADWQPPSDQQLIEAITPALRQHFAAALLARMQVIPFRPLDEEALATVVAMRLDGVADRLQQAHGMTFRVDRQVVEQLTRQCQVAENGARQVEAMIEQQLLPGLSRQLLAYMAEDNLPDILTLTLDETGAIEAIFSDREASEEEALTA